MLVVSTYQMWQFLRIPRRELKHLYPTDIKGKEFVAYTTLLTYRTMYGQYNKLKDLLGHYVSETLLFCPKTKEYIIVSGQTSYSRGAFDACFEAWAKGEIKITDWALVICSRRRKGVKIYHLLKFPFPLWCCLYPQQSLEKKVKAPKYYYIGLDEIRKGD